MARRGSNRTVKIILRRLVKAGFDIGPSGIDGIWGKNTEKAYNAFVKQYGKMIKPHGNSKTYDQQFKMITENNYDTGGLDGIEGKYTKQAYLKLNNKRYKDLESYADKYAFTPSKKQDSKQTELKELPEQKKVEQKPVQLESTKSELKPVLQSKVEQKSVLQTKVELKPTQQNSTELKPVLLNQQSSNKTLIKKFDPKDKSVKSNVTYEDNKQSITKLSDNKLTDNKLQVTTKQLPVVKLQPIGKLEQLQKTLPEQKPSADSNKKESPEDILARLDKLSEQYAATAKKSVYKTNNPSLLLKPKDEESIVNRKLLFEYNNAYPFRMPGLTKEQAEEKWKKDAEEQAKKRKEEEERRKLARKKEVINKLKTATGLDAVLLEKELYNVKDPWMFLDKKEGKLYIYQGNKKVKEYVVTVGKREGDTDIQNHESQEYWNTTTPYGSHKWYNWIRSNNFNNTPAGIFTVKLIDPTSKYGIGENGEYAYDTYSQSGEKIGEPIYWFNDKNGNQEGMALHGTLNKNRNNVIMSRITGRDVKKNVSEGCIAPAAGELRELYNLNIINVGDTLYNNPEIDGNKLYFDSTGHLNVYIADNPDLKDKRFYKNNYNQIK